MLASRTSPVRTKINHGQGFTEVVFWRTDWWKGMIWFVVMLPVWLFGAVFALALLGTTDANALMLTTWMALWGAGGLLALLLLVWRSFRVEALVARPDGLTLIRRLLLLASKVPLPAARLREVRWEADDPQRVVKINGRRAPQHALVVETETGRHTLASGIDAKQAETAITALKQRLRIGGAQR